MSFPRFLFVFALFPARCGLRASPLLYSDQIGRAVTRAKLKAFGKVVRTSRQGRK